MLELQKSLEKELKELGLKDEYVTFLVSLKNLFYSDLTSTEYVDAVRKTLEEAPIGNMSMFVKTLKYFAEQIRKEIYSTYNDRAINYERAMFIGLGMEYEEANELIKLIRKANFKISPYDTVEIIKLLHDPVTTFQEFKGKVIRALAERNINPKDQRAIIFKYQTPPYNVTQNEFDQGIKLATGKLLVADQQHYKKIREMVDNTDVPDSELFITLVSTRYIESYDNISEILPYLDKIDVRSLVAAILYVASGGKTIDTKTLF